MITDLPTVDDYYTSGKELLNISWGIVTGLLIDFDEAKSYGEMDEETHESYWLAAKRRLSTALAIMQQGIEFILKERIISISPYLLLSEPPSKWPAPNINKAVSFLDFRTIDAQDLIKVIDTFSDIQMPSEFVKQFDLLRKKRNRIIHSVDKNLDISTTEFFESLLFMYKVLFPMEQWATTRLYLLEREPESELGAYEYSVNRICLEMSLVIDLLKPAKVKNFFGIEKKQRRYFCPTCYANANTDIEFEYKLAILTPKGPDSNKLYCPICNDTYSVSRSKCDENDCKGNVKSENGKCLTCGH